jgi:hypothetical protein
VFIPPKIGRNDQSRIARDITLIKAGSLYQGWGPLHNAWDCAGN